MAEAVVQKNALQHDRASDGTAYWTASLYVSAESIRALYKQKYPSAGEIPPHPLGGEKLDRDRIARWQLSHWPSFALRNAIEPLFNDIADRDLHGKPQDFLFAAGLGTGNPRRLDDQDKPQPWASLAEGAEALLGELHLDVTIPQEFSWTTEGIRFFCHLPDTSVRRVILRRFWHVHNDGGLSYHLSFSHYYGDHYGPSSYYFLSLMQKLLAPKEFALSDGNLEKVASGERAYFSAFDAEPLGIDPLDHIEFAVAKDIAAPSEAPFDGRADQRFWPFVRERFVADADLLFREVFVDRAPANSASAATRFTDGDLKGLINEVEFLEVPGLKLPRCRYLFHIHDNRFFDRLLPIDPLGGESLPRKRCVQDNCYLPYQEAMDRLIDKARGGTREVHLGDPGDGRSPDTYLSWTWVAERSDYVEDLAAGLYQERIDGEAPRPLTEIAKLEAAMHRGTAYRLPGPKDKFTDPIRLHIPAFAEGRADCLDYLFLSGFNQNIIDFMNQDPSEILDSTDPLYPTGELDADERFFVRYANQRGMISYVPKSRSLEIGNDYIGTCPYAFLIHVLAMHNEFLARDHERRSDGELAAIDKEISEIERAIRDEALGHDPKTLLERSTAVELKINTLKRDTFWHYQRHRYLDVFRYDTEAKVFKKLEELRGNDRRTNALTSALRTLEDYANDVDRRQAEAARASAEAQRTAGEKRQAGLRNVLAGIALLSTFGLLFTLGDYFDNHPVWSPRGPWTGGAIIGTAAWILTTLGIFVILALTFRHWKLLFEGVKASFERASSDRN